MTQFPIEDPADPRLADYRELNERNLTRQSGRFIAEGDKVVERLIASPYSVASVLAEQAWADRLEPLLPAETPIYVAERSLLEQTIGFNFHRGVLAAGLRGKDQQLHDVISQLPSRATVVVCPDVHDPTNLGVLIRTAAAFGVAALVLGKDCAYAFSRRVLRVSMGAVLHIPIIESKDLAADLDILKAARFEIAATVLDIAAEPLNFASRGERLALLFGSEGHGLEQRWIEACDRRITLPMRSGIDSLNVAIASAVFLYHFTRE